MEKQRIIIAVVCAVIIIGMGIFLIANWNSVFVSKIEITYPDGCIEKFENDVAVSPICTNGRLLKEEEDRKNQPVDIVQPITFPNSGFYNTED